METLDDVAVRDAQLNELILAGRTLEAIENRRGWAKH